MSKGSLVVAPDWLLASFSVAALKSLEEVDFETEGANPFTELIRRNAVKAENFMVVMDDVMGI
jgi:hypothetical protein